MGPFVLEVRLPNLTIPYYITADTIKEAINRCKKAHQNFILLDLDGKKLYER